MKKLMVLGAGILQLPGIIEARRMGLEVIAIDINPKAIGFSVDGVVSENISTIDTASVLQAAKKHKIDAIMTLASDMPVRTVAAVCEELNLIGVDKQTAINTTNKAVMRACLKENNVPCPKFCKITDEKSLLERYREFSGKVIMKPVDNSGSRGVVQLKAGSSEKELIAAYNYSKKLSRCGDVIIEEFMEGHEVSVESITVDGVCHIIQITDKLTTGSPYFVEMGHSEPSTLSKEVTDAITDITKAATKAVGITNGPAHTEIIVTNEGPKIVELGARLGGDNITSHLVPLSTGVNMIESCIKIALGIVPNLQQTRNRCSAIRYLTCENGVIERISGVDSAKVVKNITDVEIVHNPGYKAGTIKNSDDRIGFVIAEAKTVEEAIKSCEEALNLISVKIKKAN